MTGEKKQGIQEMRRQGFSNTQIADTLGLSVNTVKSFCRRNNLKAEKRPTACDASNETGNEESEIYEENKDICKQCGKQLIHNEKSKPKRFCCDKCRFKWWNANRDKLNRKLSRRLICAYCGETINHSDSKRKYCCHDCYVADRFGKAQRKEAVAQA